jgi:hypothetical protein
MANPNMEFVGLNMRSLTVCNTDSHIHIVV